MLNISKAIERTNEVIAKILSVILVAAVLTGTYEVLMRYLFNRPTIWVWEINGFLLTILCGFGGGYALLRSTHVRVDIVYQLFSTRTKAFIDVGTAFFTFLFLGTLLWQAGKLGIDSVRMLERSLTVFGTPVYPFKALLCLGIFMFLMQAAVGYVRDLNIALEGRKSSERHIVEIINVILFAVIVAVLITGRLPELPEMGLSIEAISVILFALMMAVLVTGLPVVFVLGGIGTLFTILIYGFDATMGMYMSTWSAFTSQVLLAVPFFLLMASVLQYSGIAEDIYAMFHKWMGGLRGGLCIGTVVICMIFAAITGTSGAATISMALIALPSMLKRGYNKHMAVGAIMGGGVLGIVIPPSIIMILYSLVARLPIGKMFMGGVFPGIVCGCLFIIYISVKCWVNPQNGPAIPLTERATLKEKLIAIRALILPLALVVVVLGSIWVGIATPTEASAIGAFGAFICAAAYRRLKWDKVKEALLQTVTLTGMAFWIFAGATVFTNLYTQLGARDMVQSFATSLAVSPWIIVIFMQLSLFVLGCIMDDYAIVMLAAPIYVPIVKALGFDPLWFGILFILNMSIAYLTPPYGFNLFYMKSLVPIIKKETGVELTMGDIYRGAAPFILLMLLNLALCMVFPEIITWFPNTIFG